MSQLPLLGVQFCHRSVERLWKRPIQLFGLSILAMIAASGVHWAAAAELWVGAASTSITPRLPVSLAGQMHTRIATKVESPVTANVLVLESREGGKSRAQAVFVACDLVAIRGGLLEAVRERVSGRVPDIGPQQIILSATHTHTAPTMIDGRYHLTDDRVIKPSAYVAFAADRIAAAVETAWKARQPARVGWGLGHAVVALNRRAVYADGRAAMYGRTDRDDFRGIEGHEDHGVEALFFWNQKQELIATVINVACPAQAVEGRHTVNADYWHPVRQLIQAKYGPRVVVLGWIGAAGDHVPRPMYRKRAEERMRKLRGTTLLEDIASRIVAGWEEAREGACKEMAEDVAFEHRVQTIELPLRRVTDEEYARVKQEVARYADDATKVWIRNWKQSVLDRYETQKAGRAEPYRMELHTLRVGDVAIATNDFELFGDYGTQMKARSPALQTFVIQLCGGGTYIPTPRAVAGGGYSAVIESSVVGPKGGQVLTDETVTALRELFPAKER